MKYPKIQSNEMADTTAGVNKIEIEVARSIIFFRRWYDCLCCCRGACPEADRELLSKATKQRDNLSGKATFGYITKANNPFDSNSRTKIYIIAGIRGIGTWGAAECIKKAWRQIYDKIDSAKKESNFSALIRIKYLSLDITDIKVIQVTMID